MAQDIQMDPHTVDRVKLPFAYDTDVMRAEVDAMGLHPFIYYSSIMLKLPHERKPEDPPTSYPYINSLIDDFNAHSHVTLARILRLEPGAEVKQHCDPMLGLEIPDSVVRLTIPIFGGEGVTFYLNDKPVPMNVNLTLDVKPNDWMRSVIQKAYESALVN